MSGQMNAPSAHRLDVEVAIDELKASKLSPEFGAYFHAIASDQDSQPKFDPTLLVAIIGVLGMVIAAVVPKPELPPPAFEQASGQSLSDARIEGYRAGVRQAQEQGCVFPVALSHPLGEQP